MTSIRNKLLRWLLPGLLLSVALTGGGGTFFYVRAELEELLDDRLKQLAHSIPLQTTDMAPTTPKRDNGTIEDDGDYVIQVWRSDGTLLLLLNQQEGSPEAVTEGFSTHWSDGIFWRSFSLQRGDYLIQTSQPVSDRLEISTDVALGVIVPVLVLIVVLSALVWISVGRGLQSLTELVTDLGRRNPYSLTPLETKDLPEEIRPLVSALNELLHRLSVALESQRNFVADAAHELRTPLTAVQLQAQLLQRIDNAEDRTELLTQIRAGTARAGHLVNQLLTLARMEPDKVQQPINLVDLSSLVKSVVAEYAVAALERQIDLGVHHDEQLSLQGDVQGLRVMVRNLVDNAIRYTPQGGKVDVLLQQAGIFIQLEVIDSGDGIPEAERKQVFARFYRRPGMHESGSGLGLAIVQEIVNRHSGQIQLTDSQSGTGLRVIVKLSINDKGFESSC